MSEPREATFCPECGSGVPVDEDGCCAYCGATATGRAIAALTAERDRYREFVEHVLVATMDGTYAQLDTPAILDQLQCSAAEAVGEERFGELFNALNREE